MAIKCLTARRMQKKLAWWLPWQRQRIPFLVSFKVNLDLSSLLDGDDKKSKNKRGVLPKHATNIMRSWLFQHLMVGRLLGGGGHGVTGQCQSLEGLGQPESSNLFIAGVGNLICVYAGFHCNSLIRLLVRGLNG